jgi:hypothetical protein
VTAAGDERAQLTARGALLRGKVDELLTDLNSRTERLREAQRTAAALSATVTSTDRRIRVSVDATGMVTELWLAPTAFDHSRPDVLARALGDLIRQATMRVRGQRAEVLRPLTENLPDVSDLVPGAPSLREMLPSIPEGPAPDAGAPPTGPDRPTANGGFARSPFPAAAPPVAASPRVSPPVGNRHVHPPAPEDEEMPATWMRDDDL